MGCSDPIVKSGAHAGFSSLDIASAAARDADAAADEARAALAEVEGGGAKNDRLLLAEADHMARRLRGVAQLLRTAGAASPSLNPRSLVNKRVHVEGMGPGRVTKFVKHYDPSRRSAFSIALESREGVGVALGEGGEAKLNYCAMPTVAFCMYLTTWPRPHLWRKQHGT